MPPAKTPQQFGHASCCGFSLSGGLSYIGGVTMGKDPAFLFYPNDWLGGTMGMTFEEKGAYMSLLMMQFNRGHMTTHMIGQEVGQLWDKIKDKFVQDDNGLWYNVRLEVEKNKRQTFVQSRRNNIRGVNQHTKKSDKSDGHTEGHMTTHMENENEDENKVVIDYDFILNNYHELCKNMPRVIKLAGERKGYVNARFGEFGMEKIIEVLRLAGESDFLNGENDKRWKADFEWIMRPNNFIKILEGKYNNKPKRLILSR